MGFKDCNFTSLRAALRIERLKKLLADGPLTGAEVAARLYCSKPLALIYLRYLREGENRCVRVVDYVRTNGASAARFGLGTEPDAPVPPVLTRAERDALRVDTPEKKAAFLADRRVKYKERHAKRPREPKKSRAMYNPPLIQQVEKLIAERPRYTTGQLATVLNVEPAAVSTAANRLARAGKVEAQTNGKSTRRRWVSLTRPPVQHAPSTMPKRSIFAALGL